jgi:hypothetical protein
MTPEDRDRMIAQVKSMQESWARFAEAARKVAEAFRRAHEEAVRAHERRQP